MNIHLDFANVLKENLERLIDAPKHGTGLMKQPALGTTESAVSVISSSPPRPSTTSTALSLYKYPFSQTPDHSHRGLETITAIIDDLRRHLKYLPISGIGASVDTDVMDEQGTTIWNLILRFRESKFVQTSGISAQTKAGQIPDHDRQILSPSKTINLRSPASGSRQPDPTVTLVALGRIFSFCLIDTAAASRLTKLVSLGRSGNDNSSKETPTEYIPTSVLNTTFRIINVARKTVQSCIDAKEFVLLNSKVLERSAMLMQGLETGFCSGKFERNTELDMELFKYRAEFWGGRILAVSSRRIGIISCSLH